MHQFFKDRGLLQQSIQELFGNFLLMNQLQKKTASIGDVGVSNFFPFSLLSPDVRKNFVYYSTHGIRSENLLIQLEFSEPLSKIWYMIVVSEFLVSIKFNAATGAPTFKIVED